VGAKLGDATPASALLLSLKGGRPGAAGQTNIVVIFADDIGMWNVRIYTRD
jgi:hypothetical protein